MKRKHIRNDEYEIYKVFSLFAWHLCEKCKKEFRREKGWRFLVGPFYGGSGHWKYVCAECCPTKDAADDYALSGVWIPGRPEYMPPPPPK